MTDMVKPIQCSFWAIGKTIRPQKTNSRSIGVERVMWPFKTKMDIFGIRVEQMTCSKPRVTELALGRSENCLVKHPAVVNAAVVPKPDADRGAVVKAYVVLSPEFIVQRQLSQNMNEFDQNVIADLQSHVRGLLAPYEYPKEIEFIEQLPMTTTGKVQRRFLRLEEERRAKLT
jgi:hypothetical protein